MSSAFYTKNVPVWERVLRLALAVVLVSAALTFLPAPWSWFAAVGAVAMLATGLVGYCPACAMMGRKLDKQAKLA